MRVWWQLALVSLACGGLTWGLGQIGPWWAILLGLPLSVAIGAGAALLRLWWLRQHQPRSQDPTVLKNAALADGSREG